MPHQEGAHATAAWVEAAVHDQQHDSREALANVDVDAALSQTTLDKIRLGDRLAIGIPDLSADGLTFRRVQPLQFHGRPLVQIVYLPSQGNPVAPLPDARSPG
ncbi:hypothetical protein H3V53_22710 [Paraburkholderia bengalensis]|uniref:Uncharacterized protein n=1 Tax=Paraburkholderia bengalensis TaxID=2747562 RepID=A0ABU8IWY9_9BURK